MMFKVLINKQKYSRIKTFCEGRNIINKSQLDIEELYFIPGLNEEIINDFIQELNSVDENQVAIDNQCCEQKIDVMSLDINELYALYSESERSCFFKNFDSHGEKVDELKEHVGLFKREQKCNVLIKSLFGEISKGNKFIMFCEKNNYKVVDDLKHFDFENSKVPGIGKSSLLNLKSIYEDFCSEFNFMDISQSIIRNVASENMYIQVNNLLNTGFPGPVFERYNLNNKNIKDLESIKFDDEEYVSVYSYLSLLELPTQERFYDNSFKSLKENYQRIFLERIKGRTLESIAQDENITRERVRQVCEKVMLLLGGDALLALDAIIKCEKQGITVDEIEDNFNKNIIADILIEVCKTLDEYKYLEFSKRFVKTNIIPSYYFERISNEIKGILDGGMNLYELMDSLEESIPDFKQDFFSHDDFIPFLLSIGYKVKGNCVINGRMNTYIITHDAINRYFDFDIKLDSDEKNVDMIKLRSIIKKHYEGFALPNNNRALTAAITRDSKNIILSGRGRYCPIEKVTADKYLLNEIYRYIINSPNSTIYYSDLFEFFKSRILAETSIDNYNFLHGVLSMYYREDLDFSRDYITKRGEQDDLIDSSIINLIINRKCSISYKELLNIYPSLNKIRLLFIVERNDNLINWGKDRYNLIDNLIGFNKDVSHYLKMIIESRDGYISSIQVFEFFKEEYLQLLESNEILHFKILFYVLQTKYNMDFRFRFPHIVLRDYPIENLSLFDIAKQQLKFTNKFNWNLFAEFSMKSKLPNSTMYSVLPILKDKYCKLSENDYITKETFSISAVNLKLIDSILREYTKSTGYYAITSIRNYENYPEIGYVWNLFLIETIISTYLDSYTILSPVVKDRRYQRGIIVDPELGIESYEDLVHSILVEDGRTEYTEIELYNLLSRKDVVYKSIPQDIIKADFLKYKNEKYILVR